MIYCSTTSPDAPPIELSSATPGNPVDRLRRLITGVPWPGALREEDVRLRRLWAQRKGRTAAEFEVTADTADGVRSWLIQGVIAPGERPRHRANGEIAWGGDVPRGLLRVDHERSSWITTPDCDPELRALRPLFGKGAMRRLRTHLSCLGTTRLDAAWGDHGAASLRLIAYRIGRRMVLRLASVAGDGGNYYVKGYRRSPDHEAILRAREIASMLADRSSGMVRVPELIGFNSEMGVTVYEEVCPPAVPIGHGVDDSAVAGRIAALIHSLPRHRYESVHGIEREIDTATRWCTVLASLGSPDARRLASLAARLHSGAPSIAPEQLSVVHRDFYHRQLLGNAAAHWVVDWDTVCCGHCELDLATFVAHTILDDVLSKDTTGTWPACAQAFFESYRTAGGCYDLPRLRWYLGCALARLAAMNCARGHGSALAPLWCLAEILVEQGGPSREIHEFADKLE